MIQQSEKRHLTFTPIAIDNINGIISALDSGGEIKSTRSGYVYIDLDDSYIHQIFPLLKIDGLSKPKYFDEKTNFIGAHISLIYPDENIVEYQASYNRIDDIKIAGMFHTELENKSYYVLKVLSPSIVNFRYQLGLTKKLSINGYFVEPHITIGVSKKPE